MHASPARPAPQDREAQVREVAYAIFQETGCTDAVANWCVVGGGPGGRGGGGGGQGAN